MLHPDCKQGRLGVAEISLKRRIEGQVRSVVEKKIKRNLLNFIEKDWSAVASSTRHSVVRPRRGAAFVTEHLAFTFHDPPGSRRDISRQVLERRLGN